MAAESTAIEELSRDELESLVRDLQDRVERLEESVEKNNQKPDRLVINQLVSTLLGVDLGDYTQEPYALVDELAEFRERFEEMEEQLDAIQDLNADRTSKEEKIAQIVTYADNERSQSDTRTTVLPKNVKGVTGVSRRYAYDLVEDMQEEYDWALDPQERQRRPDEETRQKGVIIDFERLHSAGGSVNKFTTGIATNGGES